MDKKLFTRFDFITDCREGARRMREAHPHWREGQSMFNYIDVRYSVARETVRRTGIDCFYRDGASEKFMFAAWETLCMS